MDKVELIDFIHKEIVKRANVLNLDVELEDIEQLVENADKELSNEDTIELVASAALLGR